MRKQSSKLFRLMTAMVMCLCILPAAAFAASEMENNNTTAQAQNISVNDMVRGRLGTSSDEDYYRVRLTAPGYVSLDFEHDMIESTNNYWQVQIKDFDQKELAYYSFKGNEPKQSAEPIGLPAGTYYIKVENSSISHIPYGFRLNYTPSEYWETELNGTYQTADKIVLDRPICGNQHRSEDEDYFAIDLTKDEKVELRFSHDFVNDPYFGWYIDLFNKDMQSLERYTVSNGETDFVSAALQLPAGRYYLKVASNGRRNATEYNLMLSTDAGVHFSDVKPGDWFYQGVHYSAGKGFMSGLPDGTFGPKVTMTRAQLVQMLYAMEGRPYVPVTDKFSNVHSGDWFAKAVSWAVESGVTGGVGSGKFAPDAKITRQEMAVMLYAFRGRPVAEGQLNFADNADIASWASKAVVWAVDNGLMSSTSTAQRVFSPKNTATRAEASIIMMNLDKMAK